MVSAAHVFSRLLDSSHDNERPEEETRALINFICLVKIHDNYSKDAGQ